VHTCMCECVCVCAWVCLRACIHACMHAIWQWLLKTAFVMKQSKGTFTSVCIILWTFVVKKFLLIGSTSYSVTLFIQKCSGSWHAYALDVMLQCLPWAVMCKNGQWKGYLWKLWLKSGIIMYLYCN